MAMTYWSAKLDGLSDGEAALLAIYAGFPPDSPEFQGVEAWQANRHGMSGRKSDGTWQTPDEAKQGTMECIKDFANKAAQEKAKGNMLEWAKNMGRALHALQDINAPLHNYSEWHGTLNENLGHFNTELGGLSRYPVEIGSATANSAILLRGR